MATADKKSEMVTRALLLEFFQNYPDEAAALLNDLPLEELLSQLQAKPDTIFASVFLRLNPDVSSRLIEMMGDESFRKLFTVIDLVRGAVLLKRLDEETIENRLAMLPKNIADEYRELISYPIDTAGHLMDPRVTTFQPSTTVEEALNRIRKVHGRRLTDLCVVDEEGGLLGTVPLQEVAVSDSSARIGSLIREPLIHIQAMSPREDVVQLLEERKLASLPVIDLDGKLLGIIRHDALVTAVKQEATEDVQAMFGAGRDERALSKVSFAIRKRLPWLEINLATAFLAAAVVGIFEDTIARITALAVFLPVVAGQSGNTGSQALAVTMRGLALREIRTRHWFRVSRKEIAVGFVNGCVVSATTSVIAYAWMRSFWLSVVIGIAMVFSMVIAAFAGAVIPVILKSLGQDPAQSSSIILTTVTDVVGFMSFLGLATILSNRLLVS